MGAAGIGIVVKENVALVDIALEGLHHLGGRIGDGEDVDRVVGLPLGDQPTVSGDQGTGEIMPFVDDRRIGTADHVGPHLVDDGDERFADQFETAEFIHGGKSVRVGQS